MSPSDGNSVTDAHVTVCICGSRPPPWLHTAPCILLPLLILFPHFLLVGRAELAGSSSICLLSPLNRSQPSFCSLLRQFIPLSYAAGQRTASSGPRTSKSFPRTLLSSTIAMGNLIWHEWSRYVSITASLCEWFLLRIRSAKLEPRLHRHYVGGLLGHLFPQVLLRLCRWNVACAWRSPVSSPSAILGLLRPTPLSSHQTIECKCLLRHYCGQGPRCSAYLHSHGDRDGRAGVPSSTIERHFNTAELYSEDSAAAHAGFLCHIVLSGLPQILLDQFRLTEATSFP